MNRINVLMWLFPVLLVIGCTALCPAAVTAQTSACQQAKEKEDDDDDESLSAEDRARVKITLDEARAIALKRVPGTVLDEELEKEGSRLQYAFDICSEAGKIWDVEVSAIDGTVLQAVEDDDDPGGARSSVPKARHSIYRAASAVRNATTRAIGRLF